MDAIGFRAATVDDFEFFFDLHEQTLGPYVDQVWGWDEEEQRAYLQRTIDVEATTVIVVAGVDAGRLNVEHREHDVYLELIEISPEHQGRGIGERIVRSVLDDAFARRLSVRLSVLGVNTGAYRLYRRLGFAEVARHGDVPAVRVQMVAQPPTSTSRL